MRLVFGGSLTVTKKRFTILTTVPTVIFVLRIPGATAPFPAALLERPVSAQNCGTGAWPIERPASMEPGESQTGYCNQIPFEMQRQLAILHLGSVTVL